MRGPTEIAPGIHGLGTEIVNGYLVEEDDGLVAVDAGFPGFAGTLDEDLRRIGRSPGDVAAVVLTHSDGDPTGDASPRHVLANMWRPLSRTILRDTLRHGGARPSKVPDPETFADGDVLDVPARPRVVHTPGHTGGLLFEGPSVLFASDALITHELVTKGEGPRLMPHFVNEDDAACLASLDRIEALDAELVLVGHGEPWRHGAAEAARRARAAGRV